MPIEKVTILKPDLQKCFPLTWKNFLNVAYPDATIWAINLGDGWFLCMAKADMSASLATERGELKTYSKLDTAIDQLSKAGIKRVIAHDARGMTND